MKTFGWTLLVTALITGAFLAGAYFGPALGIGNNLAARGYAGPMGSYGMHVLSGAEGMGPGSYGMMGGGWIGLPFMLFGWLPQIGLVAVVVLGIVWVVRTLGGRAGITPGANRSSQ